MLYVVPVNLSRYSLPSLPLLEETIRNMGVPDVKVEFLPPIYVPDITVDRITCPHFRIIYEKLREKQQLTDEERERLFGCLCWLYCPAVLTACIQEYRKLNNVPEDAIFVLFFPRPPYVAWKDGTPYCASRADTKNNIIYVVDLASIVHELGELLLVKYAGLKDAHCKSNTPWCALKSQPDTPKAPMLCEECKRRIKALWGEA